MSRHSLSRLFAFWTWSKPRRSSAAAAAWPEIPVRMSMASPGAVRPDYTPEQLDELHGMLSTGCDRRPHRSPVVAIRRQVPDPRAVRPRS